MVNVLQTGANVAVTQLKSNNCDEGQFFFLFFFSSSSAALYRRLGWVSQPPLLSLTQLEEERREKKCQSPTFTLEIPHSVFCMWIKRFREWKIIVSCVHYTITLCTSWPSSLNRSHSLLTHTQIHFHRLTFPWDSLWPCCIQRKHFPMYVRYNVFTL